LVLLVGSAFAATPTTELLPIVYISDVLSKLEVPLTSSARSILNGRHSEGFPDPRSRAAPE
jgi:hypothetical protein